MLNISLHLLFDDGTYRCPLPDVTKFDISEVAGSAGAVSLTYPADGINFLVLHEHVVSDKDCQIAIWYAGQDSGSKRALLMEADGDSIVEEGTWTYSGHFFEHRLTEYKIIPIVGAENGEAVFGNASAGAIMSALMQLAQANGFLTDITFSSFSSSLDSNGVAWGQTTTITLSPGTDLLDVAQQLNEQGLCDFEITPAKQLRLYKWGTRGVDRTLQPTPVVLRVGRDLIDAPRKHSVRPSVTDMLGVGSEGLKSLKFSASARSRRGRNILGHVSFNTLKSQSALDAATQVALDAAVAGKLELTSGLVFQDPSQVPLQDFAIDDWLWCDTGTGTLERLRVKQYSISQDERGVLSGAVTLNDSFSDAVEALEKKLRRLTTGATVVGTSTPNPEGGDDAVAPNPPTGVVATSLAYYDETGALLTAVMASWVAPTTNIDSTVITDLASYNVRWAYVTGQPGLPTGWQDAGSTTGLTLDWGPVAAGVDIQVQVQAVDRSGNLSAWSASYIFTTQSDLTPPPIPSTPTATNFLREIVIGWNGLDSSGAVLDQSTVADLSHLEVHFSTTNNFTPSTSTRFETIFGKGGVVFTGAVYGTTYYFKLISVDRTGNKSAASGQASAVGVRAIADDIADQVITAAKIANAQPLGPKISSEQISTPHLTVANFGDNEAPNGGFEDPDLADPTKPGGWTATGTNATIANLTLDTTAANVHSGTKSAKVTFAAGAARHLRLESDWIPTKPGELWFIEVAAKASRVHNGMTVTVDYSSGAVPSEQVNDVRLLNGAFPIGFTVFEYNSTAPATAGGLPTRWVRFKVETRNNDSAALDVWWDELRARKVTGTAEIADAAIVRAKIGNLAVGDAQIETASVGKLTTGTLTAVVTLSGVIRTASAGARFEADSAGFRLYNSAGVQTVNFNTATGSALITGQMQTALSGTRMVINPANANPDRIDFFANAGTQFASIEAVSVGTQGAITITGNNSSGVRGGTVLVRPSFAHLLYGNKDGTAIQTEIYVDTGTARMNSIIVDLVVRTDRAAPGGNRVSFTVFDAAGNRIPKTQLNYWNTGTAGGEPWLAAVNNDSGIIFSDAVTLPGGPWGPCIFVVGNLPSTHRDVRAKAFIYDTGVFVSTSSREVKRDIARVRDVNMRQATKRARAHRFRNANLDEGPVRNPEGKLLRDAVEAPLQIGLLAEELPEAVQVMVPASSQDHTLRPGLDISALISLTWSGLGDAFEDIEQLETKMAALEAAVAALKAKK